MKINENVACNFFPCAIVIIEFLAWIYPLDSLMMTFRFLQFIVTFTNARFIGMNEVLVFWLRKSLRHTKISIYRDLRLEFDMLISSQTVFWSRFYILTVKRLNRFYVILFLEYSQNRSTEINCLEVNFIQFQTFSALHKSQ